MVLVFFNTRPWHCCIAALFWENMPYYDQPKGSQGHKEGNKPITKCT